MYVFEMAEKQIRFGVSVSSVMNTYDVDIFTFVNETFPSFFFLMKLIWNYDLFHKCFEMTTTKE